MKKSLSFAIFGIGFIVVAILAIGGRGFFARQPLQVQAAHEQGARSVKWEYCVLHAPNSNVTAFDSKGDVCIEYLQETRVQSEVVEAVIEKKLASTTIEHLVLSKAIAKLGNDGWEMVGEGETFRTLRGEKTIMFKRPKRFSATEGNSSN